MSDGAMRSVGGARLGLMGRPVAAHQVRAGAAGTATQAINAWA